MIRPGGVLGVFGGGQLGRMFAQAAARLGYRVHVFAPEADAPAAEVAWRHTRADYEDLDAVRSFAAQVDGVTYEFENVPAEAAEEAARHAPVSPQPHVLATAQDRAREKRFLSEHGVPVAPFGVVTSADDLAAAAGRIGYPSVVKTSRGGYDGKGQVKLRSAEDVGAAWRALRAEEAVLEGWVPFECEVSVLVARGETGDAVTFGPIRNAHADHILDVSTWPCACGEAVERRARDIATQVADALGLVGVCCIEMFVKPDGEVLVNEFAPRPHNSGHLTIELCAVSQFEQQVRTLCGLPLVDWQPRAPAAAMANLLGDVWRDAAGEPDWSGALGMPGVALHLYGKREAKVGRKMGHLTVLGESPHDALRRAVAARTALGAVASRPARAR